MKRPHIICLLLPLLWVLTGCHETKEYPDDPYGNFDALWSIIDKRYCFLEEKGIDWDFIGSRYRSLINPEMTLDEYFSLLGAMINELEDGHCNLSSGFNTTYYRRWWSDYPQDFDLRTLQQYYLCFDWRTTSGIMYRNLTPDVGYIYYPSFATTVSESGLDYILAWFSECKVLIIDIRDNGGGALTNIETFVGRFITEEVTGGYISHKTGPGHGDFSEPYRFTYKAATGRVGWRGKPLILLTNRSSYSAANDFAAVMKSLPQTTVIGARTGGGGGAPFCAELPNGWLIRFSACPIYSPDGECIEDGVDPTPGYECHSLTADFAAGRDPILDLALSTARTLAAGVAVPTVKE